MTTDISICNAALLMANASEINSFDDSTREARMCKALYETTKNFVMQKHPWSFTLFQEELAQTINTPLFDYRYEYQLPTDYLRILKIDTPPGNEYRILKDKLLTDQTAVEVLYQKDPGEAFYPAYFTRTVEFRMAELLSKALVQDENMAQIYQADYLLAIREARGIDSQNSPNLTIDETSLLLTAVRGGAIIDG
jgi:hypothetical protein